MAPTDFAFWWEQAELDKSTRETQNLLGSDMETKPGKEEWEWCVCACVRVCVCWCEGPVVGVTSLLVAGQERTYYRGAVKEGGREQL